MSQHIIISVLTFYSVPVFIHKLGLEQYGVFASVSVIGNLNMLTNLGLNNALLTYLSQQGKCRRSDHDIIVTQIILLSILLPFLLLGYLFSGFIVHNIFSIEPEHAKAAIHLLFFLMPANVLLLLGQSYAAVLDSMQKIYWTNICQFIYSSIYWGGMIVVLHISTDLKIIGIIAFLAACIWFFLLLILVRIYWGQLDYSRISASFMTEAKKQVSFGTKMYLSGLSGFLFEPLSKILLSHFCGSQYVGCFEIGQKIRGIVSGLITKTLYPVYPYIASQKTKEEIVALKKNMIVFSVKIQQIMTIVCIFFLYLIPSLVLLWLKQDATHDVIVAVLLSGTPYLLFSPSSLPIYFYLPARGYPEKTIIIQLSSAIGNVITFFALYKFLGWESILWGNIVGYLCSYLFCQKYQMIYFEETFKSWYQMRISPLIVLLISLIVFLLYRSMVPIKIWETPFFIAVLLVFFIAWMRYFKWIDEKDLTYVPFLSCGMIQIAKKILIQNDKSEKEE